MGKLGYSIKLMREFVGFARAHRAYWIIPLMLLLGFAVAIVVAGQGSGPLLYTLF